MAHKLNIVFIHKIYVIKKIVQKLLKRKNKNITSLILDKVLKNFSKYSNIIKKHKEKEDNISKVLKLEIKKLTCSNPYKFCKSEAK